MRAKIIRLDKSEEGVFGVLTLNGQPECVTLERPWKDNQPNISCIPPEIYVCRSIDSPKFGQTFEVMNVPGRTHILFHKGNLPSDSLGCILLASKYGELEGKRAILASGKAFNRFMEKLKEVDFFSLQIINI